MSSNPDQTALLNALRQLLEPVARLAVARGLPYAALDDLLRGALVEQARRLQPGPSSHGLVSRVSTATGLTRREVGRLLETAGSAPPAPRGLADEVFARWRADALYQQQGRPRALPRTGPAPSFESLAQSVTRDVHPRSLLDELCRLELADCDAATDTVRLRADTFVPRASRARMFELLGDNVGDHLEAAVDNVLGAGDAHFEQAVYADGLSAASVQALRPLIAAQWTALFERLAPALDQHLAADQAGGQPQDQRVRIGLYSFSAPARGTGSALAPDAAPGAAPDAGPDAAPEPAADPAPQPAGRRRG